MCNVFFEENDKNQGIFLLSLHNEANGVEVW